MTEQERQAALDALNRIEQTCWYSFDVSLDYSFEGDIQTIRAALSSPRVEDDIDAVNLRVLVRRLAVRHPNEKLRDQAMDYIRRTSKITDVLRGGGDDCGRVETSPAVPVIDNGVPTNEDIDWFEGWVDKQAKSKSAFEAHDLWIMFQCIAMARAYAALPKLQKVDLDWMKYIAPEETSIPYQATGYNRAIDDIKSKYGELYAEVKE